MFSKIILFIIFFKFSIFVYKTDVMSYIVTDVESHYLLAMADVIAIL